MDTEPRLCQAPMWTVLPNFSTTHRDQCHRLQPMRTQMADAAITQVVAPGSSRPCSHLPLQPSSPPSGTLTPFTWGCLHCARDYLTSLHDRGSLRGPCPSRSCGPRREAEAQPSTFPGSALKDDPRVGVRGDDAFCSAPCLALSAPVGMCRGILKMLEPAGTQGWMRLFSMMVLLVSAALECLQEKQVKDLLHPSAVGDTEAP